MKEKQRDGAHFSLLQLLNHNLFRFAFLWRQTNEN